VPQQLSQEALLGAVEELGRRDADLRAIAERFGPPPLWARPPGFPTLLRIILEQQVSLASADAAFERLRASANPLEPQRFLRLTDPELLAIGFSRQKTRYARLLAHAIEGGSLDLAELQTLDDEAARAVLTGLTGVGPWTASIYLLMALLRPDVWPPADIALAAAMQEVKGLDRRPTTAEMAETAEAWRPWRAVAARLLWHHYLSIRAS
jgi:DNA-3-methyladenine glycosylase II